MNIPEKETFGFFDELGQRTKFYRGLRIKGQKGRAALIPPCFFKPAKKITNQSRAFSVIIR